MIFFILLTCLTAVKGSGIHPEIHNPQPYSFGYTIKDKESVQHRQETGNGVGIVHGNYGFIDNKGLRRQVDYVADHGGFRAAVHTNEPGTSGQSPAAVYMKSSGPHAHGAAVPFVSKEKLPLVPAHHESRGVHGIPAVYDQRTYGRSNQGYAPAPNRHMFLTPVEEHMPLHLPEHRLPLHQPQYFHMPSYMPVHGHIAQIPAHSYNGVFSYAPHRGHIY